jgi:DNA-binding transcriptional MerR regulator
VGDMNENEWSIQEIARLSGTTSRTLRHYGDVGLLAPSRVGDNGYRYYDERALVRLQRILMLRDLGLGLPSIGEVLDGQRDDGEALAVHLRWLRQEQQRLDRQISAVEGTIEKLKGGENLMAEESLDGFDHTRYREEVVERWGEKAYADSDAWWRSKSEVEKAEWMSRQKQLAADWIAAVGTDPTSPEAQELARRQHDWLAGIPVGPSMSKEYFNGLGAMYVADERFAKNYGGVEGATFVRDAMAAWAEGHL